MREVNEHTKEWIKKGDHDLGSAKLIYLHIPNYFDTIAFHCQQAVEKYLKAVLHHNEIEIIRTHNLIYLLDKISEIVFISENLYNNAIILNEFSVQIRYPNSSIYLTNNELKEAIEIAENFRNFILEILELNDDLI